VGHTDDEVGRRLRQFIAAALEKEPGALYDWIREVWRHGHDIGAFCLQEDVMPKDLAMFEQYWISQFAGMLDDAGSRVDKTNSAVAQQVISAIKGQLGLKR